MQTLKINKFLLIVVNPSLLLFGVLVFYYFPTMLLSLFSIFWIMTACALILVFTRAGNCHLANAHHATTRLPWQPWICSIILIELALIGGYLGISALCGNFFTVNTTTHAALFETSLTLFSLHYGLFPWSLYALIAAGMAYTAYHDETDAYLSNLLKPFFSIEPHSFYGLIANVGMRRCVVFSISILFVFTALLLTHFLLPLNIHIAHGFDTSAIVVSLSIFALSYSDSIKKYLIKLFSRNIPTTLSFPLFCTALGAICIILTLFSNGLYKNTAAEPPALAIQWIQYNWQTAWIIFSVLWFLCLTPLICPVIARLSKGYRAREVIIGVLAFPLLLALFFILKNTLSLNVTLTPFLITLLSVIALLVLMPLLINHHHFSSTMMAYLPKNGLHKNRDTHSFIIEFVRITAVALFLYLTIGMNGLALFLFAPNFLSILTLPLTAIAVVKHLLERS
ncbi:MAG: BCCT family transporter [Coxiellaceae bacterium]|nr:BCCT family transporter [Coxiellaceae bacterium]